METIPQNSHVKDVGDCGCNTEASWKCSTNWIVDRGSLNSVVTFESPGEDSELVDSTQKSPLLLKPPSPDSGPCEINICLKGKHEVLQIYVRSTARVYEIYCAPSLHSSSDYLCTVRCCVAVRDGELLQALVREATPEQPEQITEEKSAEDSCISTSEDDWVEIKDPSSSPDGNSSLPKKNCAITEQSVQDLFEATAEISDSDPCISITLRLLSLQSKGCVYIDEIYAFGDPVESTDMENQAAQVGSAAGSSVMSLMVPTLLQLCKSSVSGTHGNHSSNTSGNHEYLKMASKTSNSAIVANENLHSKCLDPTGQQRLNRQEPGATEAKSPKSEIPTQSTAKDKTDAYNVDFKCSRVETFLEQLVSRVCSVEDICLRFEENMLKPINNIETRLQRVEQQLEILSKNSLNPGLQACMRISAPSFPFCDSNSSSFYNDGCEIPPPLASGMKEHCPSGDSFNNSLDASIPTNTSQFLPTLVVSAPEFSCGDDENGKEVVEPPNDSSHVKSKKNLSIDDALAAALAGFMAPTPIQAPKYTQSLQVLAPEFTSEENGNSEQSHCSKMLAKVSPDSPNGNDGNVEPSNCIRAPKYTDHKFESKEIDGDGEVASPGAQVGKPVFLTQSIETVDAKNWFHSDPRYNDTAKVDCTEKQIELNDEFSDKTSRVDELGSGVGSLPTGVNNLTEGKHDLAGEDKCPLTEDTSRGEACTGNDTGALTSLEKNDIARECVEDDNTSGNCDTIVEGIVESTGSIAEEVPEYLQNNGKASSLSSVVDFRIPILDVKFTSSGSSSTMFPLETLLVDCDEDALEVPNQQENELVLIGIQENSIPEDLQEHPSNDNHLLVDFQSDLGGDDLTKNDEMLENTCPSTNQYVVTSLI